MRTHEYIFVKNGIEMYESLHKAVIAAGGSPDSFSVSELEKMTALDLIKQLATNKIRFIYENKELTSNKNCVTIQHNKERKKKIDLKSRRINFISELGDLLNRYNVELMIEDYNQSPIDDADLRIVTDFRLNENETIDDIPKDIDFGSNIDLESISKLLNK